MSQPQAEPPKVVRTWSPPWAPHVRGDYTDRQLSPEGAVDEPSRIFMKCGQCGDEQQRTCDTGMVRNHIATFARVHMHQEHFNPARKA